jgi:hypothetical protein
MTRRPSLDVSRPPRAPDIRFRVEPSYAPPDKIARKLCLTGAQFRECQRRLYARGFPLPDETTGMYDLEAVDRWRKRQRPDLYPELTIAAFAPETAPPRRTLGEKSREAQERLRNG